MGGGTGGMTSSFFGGAFVGEDRRNAGVAMPIPAEGFVERVSSSQRQLRFPDRPWYFRLQMVKRHGQEAIVEYGE